MAESADPSIARYSARFYQPTLRTIPNGMSTLLASYSGVPEEAQREHITRIRDRAYARHPYPCLGRWRFLDLDLSIHPLYATNILPALRGRSDGEGEGEGEGQGHTWLFLDLGCCLGQDIRKLICDGADASRLRGADLRPEFIECGYDLFCDRDRFPISRFIAPADVFDLSPTAPLAQLDGKVGILHVCAVFHLFDLPGQKALAHRVLRLLARNAQGFVGPQQQQETQEEEKRSSTCTKALIIGAQTANINAGEYERRPGDGQWRYRHNHESWTTFWQEAIAQPEWTSLIKHVQVGSLLEARTSGLGDPIISTDDTSPLNPTSSTITTTTKSNVDANNSNLIHDGNTFQRQIGLVEEGFRWMKWWVWVTFAE
ncbi:hypothetical protein B0A52_04446 [Exophiala mesophila]|uniref:Methyltransferase domain-containing protein n=1 Tax=Exophiala mesophila TaxID=212818 RepID=A0A438N9E5_EXOME|nr:hypothetical protein B0A52_04446 [Exophiala mesophila]